MPPPSSLRRAGLSARRHLTLTAALATAVTRASAQCAITSSPDAVTCPRCSIAVRTTLKLGGDEDEVLAVERAGYAKIAR